MFDIRLEKRFEIRFNKAVKAIDRRTRAWKDDLPRLYVTAYYRAVLRAIETQRFASSYDQLSKKYKKWKENHGYSPKFWIKTGAVRDALKERAWRAMPVAQGGDYVEYIASLPDEVSWYAGLTEWGYRGRGKGGKPMVIPPRQVFSPIMDNLRDEFEKYTGRALADLATAWGKK